MPKPTSRRFLMRIGQSLSIAGAKVRLSCIHADSITIHAESPEEEHWFGTKARESTTVTLSLGDAMKIRAEIRLSLVSFPRPHVARLELSAPASTEVYRIASSPSPEGTR